MSSGQNLLAAFSWRVPAKQAREMALLRHVKIAIGVACCGNYGAAATEISLLRMSCWHRDIMA